MKYLFLILFISGCVYYPKFRAGDCIVFDEYYEAWEKDSQSIIQILQVGKENYRLDKYRYPNINWIDQKYRKIDCKLKRNK